MPLNLDAVGAKGEPRRASWNSSDSLLYSLGVGAGVEDPVGGELAFTTENTSGVEQQVLPTFVVTLGFKSSGGRSAMSQIGSFDPRMLVHGEQGVTIMGPIPTEGEVETVDEIVGIYDKGKGAVVATKSVSTLVGADTPLFELFSSVFIVGEGGFGGDRGPASPPGPPDRAPDAELSAQTRTDQALLYRLTGDRNPLHSDKQFSDVGGFPRPILHGLCTYGFTGRLLLQGLCDSNPLNFKGMYGRFSSPVMPGEKLVVQLWNDGDGCALFRTLGEDGRVVINSGTVDHRP